MNNKVIIAAAGAGKTQHIVQSAHHCVGPVLITSYTIENTEEIKSRFYKLYGRISSNITILPWYTFLLRFLIKPFQNTFIPQTINGLYMTNKPSAPYTPKTSASYYLTNDNRIYSDKIGNLAFKFINDFQGFPLINLGKIFPHIYIDEMQDMGGYDLEIAGILLKSHIHVEGVCDPRQTTYQTSNGQKNKGIKGIKIEDFLKKHKIDIDNESLNTNHRCHFDMIQLSNSLYPEFLPTECGTNYNESHLGVYALRPEDIDIYKNLFKVQELRFNSVTTKNYPKFKGKNIGDTKGRTYERTILYLPSTQTDWLFKEKNMPQGKSKALLYVALTRARFSTAIVYDYGPDFTHSIIKKFI